MPYSRMRRRWRRLDVTLSSSCMLKDLCVMSLSGTSKKPRASVLAAEGDVIAPMAQTQEEQDSHDAFAIADEAETRFDDLQRAIDDLASGRAVIVTDGDGRENEGDLVFMASMVTPKLVAFAIRHARGLICVPMLGCDLDRLQLPAMANDDRGLMGTAFTISVDARFGVTTGISAADRATTIRTLTDPASTASDLTRPGHIFPLRYAEGGVFSRAGYTEAAVDLARLAGQPPAGVVTAILNDDGSPARRPQLRAFAHEHGLNLISISQVIDYRARTERLLNRVAEVDLPTALGRWRAIGYTNSSDHSEYLAMVLGDVDEGERVLVRVHSECVPGDVFGSHHCNCGQLLNSAMQAIADDGRGALIYLRDHEQLASGLIGKLKAYRIQDNGAGPAKANPTPGPPLEVRDAYAGAQILADLGIRSVSLLSNDPAKADALTRFGVNIARRIALPV